MHNINTTVYLNDGADHFLGFAAAPAKLREAARFDPRARRRRARPAPHELRAGNRVRTTQHRRPHHSLGAALQARPKPQPPVGDVIVIAETAWACASAGWTRVTTDELHAALVAR